MAGKDDGSTRPGDVPDSAEGDAFQRAAQNLLDAIAAEPVPDRLRQLAQELDAALGRRRREAKDRDGSPHQG